MSSENERESDAARFEHSLKELHDAYDQVAELVFALDFAIKQIRFHDRDYYHETKADKMQWMHDSIDRAKKYLLER